MVATSQNQLYPQLFLFLEWSVLTFKRENGDISKHSTATSFDHCLEIYTGTKQYCNVYPPRQLLIVVPPTQVKFREAEHIFRKYSEQRIKRRDRGSAHHKNKVSGF